MNFKVVKLVGKLYCVAPEVVYIRGNEGINMSGYSVAQMAQTVSDTASCRWRGVLQSNSMYHPTEKGLFQECLFQMWKWDDFKG